MSDRSTHCHCGFLFSYIYMIIRVLKFHREYIVWSLDDIQHCCVYFIYFVTFIEQRRNEDGGFKMEKLPGKKKKKQQKLLFTTSMARGGK